MVSRGNERGTASAIFNSAQYFATVDVRTSDGAGSFHLRMALGAFARWDVIGFLLTLFMLKPCTARRSILSSTVPKCDYIAAGGGFGRSGPKKAEFSGRRQMGLCPPALFQSHDGRHFLGQFSINALTYFFITWFRLSGPGARHVDPQGRIRRLSAGDLWFHRRHPRRYPVGFPAAQRLFAVGRRKTPSFSA